MHEKTTQSTPLCPAPEPVTPLADAEEIFWQEMITSLTRIEQQLSRLELLLDKTETAD